MLHIFYLYDLNWDYLPFGSFHEAASASTQDLTTSTSRIQTRFNEVYSGRDLKLLQAGEGFLMRRQGSPWQGLYTFETFVTFDSFPLSFSRFLLCPYIGFLGFVTMSQNKELFFLLSFALLLTFLCLVRLPLSHPKRLDSVSNRNWLSLRFQTLAVRIKFFYKIFLLD